MADRNSNHSTGYQVFIMEIAVNPFVLNDLSSAQGMTYRMRPEKYDEMFLDLKARLIARMWELVELHLTKRQKQVLKLSMEGFTQNEIAKRLGINQTSVHKVLRGNIDYKYKKEGKDGKESGCCRRYGGAFKKITKVCDADAEIRNILREIREIQECLEF